MLNVENLLALEFVLPRPGQDEGTTGEFTPRYLPSPTISLKKSVENYDKCPTELFSGE